MTLISNPSVLMVSVKTAETRSEIQNWQGEDFVPWNERQVLLGIIYVFWRQGLMLLILYQVGHIGQPYND